MHAESDCPWSIECQGLSKSYGRIQSLVDCTLRVPQGVVFGLLGPNGAGKTTLIRTLMGFIKPTAGKATLGGYDVVRQSLQVRQQVSYLPADARLYRSMRGRDVLELFAGLHQHGNLAKSRQVAGELELDTSRRVMFMSTGMRQKLAISVAIGCDSPLLLLDEPTANLDPDVRQQVLALISERRRQGRTVVLSSHIFSDIDEACDEVAILRDGRVVATQHLEKVRQVHAVTLKPLSDAASPPVQGTPPFVDLVESTALQLVVHLSGPPASWMPWLVKQPFEVVRIEIAGVKAIYDRFHRAHSRPEATSDIEAS